MGLFGWGKKQPDDTIRVRRLPTAHAVPALVRVDETELWRRQGWSRSGNRYEGWYRTRFGAWRGRIEKRGDIFCPRIFDPPLRQLRRHPRWICFHLVKGKWWRIDLAINPAGRDVDSVLFNIERILDESFLRG